MIRLTKDELEISNQIKYLKNQSGTHSPSLSTLLEKLPQLSVNIDACFLSNPYATDLFLEYFNNDLVSTNKLREILEFYPSQNRVIAQSISESLRVNKDSIFVGNGAIEVIQAVLHNFVSGNIIINIPTFSSYYEFVKPDVQVIFNQLNKETDYNIVPVDLIKFVIDNKGRNLVVINPNNPNGGYLKYDEINYILKELDHLDNIIIDESFIHFAFEDRNLKMVSIDNLIEKYPNLVIIKSMSKDFGIAGIRAGYGIMKSDKVNCLLKNGYLWNMNGLSQYFFKLYSNSNFLENYEIVRKKYIQNAQEFFTSLHYVKQVKVYPSYANFALIEITDGSLTEDFVSKLLIKYGIYTRTCKDKIGLDGEFVRISARTKDENIIILNAIKSVFD